MITVNTGSLGWGVNENILAAYNFLVNNYSEGDQIFLFGFSRGSFTCRSLAGMICEFGILRQEMSGEWFAGIWDRYQGTVRDERWENERKQLTWDVPIKVMGCWDTVGSLGIPEGWFTKLFAWNKKYAFHNTELSDSTSFLSRHLLRINLRGTEIENAFHVLALDERRGPFSPTLWYIPPSNKDERRRTHLRQCWFPGVHTDVGRGYSDHVPGDMADITFAWMVDQCIGHLSFREETLDWMTQHGDFKAPTTQKERDERRKKEVKAARWGMADLHDSMKGLVAVLTGPKTRTPGQYAFKSQYLVRDQRNGSWVRITGAANTSSEHETSMVTTSRDMGKATPPKTPWYKLFGAWLKGIFTRNSRDTPVQVYTSEYIHPCVRVRMLNDPTYDPPSLRGYTLVHHAEHDQWSWVKDWTANDGRVHRTELLEYHISDASFAGMMVDRETLGYGERQDVTIPPRATKKPWWKFW